MIIDTHAHLGISRKPDKLEARKDEKYAELFGDREKVEEIDAAIAKNIEDMDAAQVDKSVICAVDSETTRGYVRVPNDVVAMVVSRHPDRFIGFASADPHKGVVAVREIERAAKELNFKGIKFLPHELELQPNDKMFYPIFEVAEELGLVVLFHSGTQFDPTTRLRYCRPVDIDDIAVDFPRLKVVIAHFGFPWYGEALAVVQRHQNIYFNIAGWAPRHFPEMVVTYMNTVLSHKALLGSDFPLMSRQRILNELRQLNLKSESLQKIISDNPKKLLDIQG